MHPLIAFLSFLFSPSDDWLLKRAYELALSPVEVHQSAESQHDLNKIYPTPVADHIAMNQWAEILETVQETEASQEIRSTLLTDPSLATEFGDGIRLKFAESDMKKGDTAKARKQLAMIVRNNNSKKINAMTDLLLCAIHEQKIDEIEKRSEEIENFYKGRTLSNKANWALGLSSIEMKNDMAASKYFAAIDDDLKAKYFFGVAQRHLGNYQAALNALQSIEQKEPHSDWAASARFQIAETYFYLKDYSLCRATINKALAENPSSNEKDYFTFRLATLDIQSKNFEGALAQLNQKEWPTNLKDRKDILLAESMIQTGKSKELLKEFGKESDEPTAEAMYRTAWAQAFNDRLEQAMELSQEGLENYYDTTFTPRLFLLQGLLSEYLGHTAEAMATYQSIVDNFPATAEAAKSANWTMLTYARNGRMKEAITHGSYLFAQIPEDIRNENPDAYYWLGELQLRMGRHADALIPLQNFLVAAKPDHPLKAYAQFETATALAAEGKSEMALAMLDDFAKTSTSLKNEAWQKLAHTQKANILFNDHEFQKAITEYRLADASAKSSYFEGAALARLDYHSDAVEVWKKAVEKFPTNTYAENGLFRAARTEFELGHATAAVNTYAQFMTQFPQSPKVKEALLQSAHVYFNSGMPEQAAPLYAEYLKKYPTTEDIAMVTPYYASSLAMMKESAENMELALTHKPPTDVLASIRWEKGATLFNQKDFSQAQDWFSRLNTDMPSYENAPTALFYRGETLFANQSWLEAEGAFKSYLNTTPAEKLEFGPMAMLHEGVSQYNRGKLLPAAKTFEMMISSFPTDNLTTSAKENLLLCYYYLGDWTTMNSMKEKYNITSNTNLSPATPDAQEQNSSAAQTVASRETQEHKVFENTNPFPHPNAEDSAVAESGAPLHQ